MGSSATQAVANRGASANGCKEAGAAMSAFPSPEVHAGDQETQLGMVTAAQHVFKCRKSGLG